MGIKSVATHAVENYTQETVSNAIKIIIDNLGGIEKFVSSGQTVFLKPNLVAPMEPEKCATTHPAVVHAVAKLCKSIGAKVIIGDSPGGPYNKNYLNMVYKKTGMATVANELGVELNKDFSDITSVFTNDDRRSHGFLAASRFGADTPRPESLFR